jgi:hypothetical protein
MDLNCERHQEQYALGTPEVPAAGQRLRSTTLPIE